MAALRACHTITANEPAAEDYRDKNIRFDITCKAVGGEYLDVEIFTALTNSKPCVLNFLPQGFLQVRIYADREIATRI
ncbi:MAG: hypothetical protein LBF83_10570 [Spirochaetaceae bacterium]|nr:hypothetical protein [Spirochaetaceae bacterium]